MQLEWKTSVQHVMIWVINGGKERRGTMMVRETNDGGKREKYIIESREEDQPSFLAIWITHDRTTCTYMGTWMYHPTYYIRVSTKDREEGTTTYQSIIWI